MSTIEQETLSEYWLDVLSHRMPLEDELDRLEVILLGHLQMHNQGQPLLGQLTPLEFIDTKRPYGNKNIANSIAFSLGWDYRRVLVTTALPEKLEAEALALHAELKLRLAATS